jgi:O-antigen/teichoic acid export membrane protein
MAVTLYTSRIVLSTLGFEDFGIYNVVGGFVTMFAFLNSAMASATQRFLSFEIGKRDFIQLCNVFSMSVNIHFIIAFVILLLAETIGLWFLSTQLTIPPERMVAAQWVYQFSIFTLMVNMMSVPYNAIIIAHERMNVFAGVSIVEVSLHLLIVFMLQWFGFDKLKLYAVLMFSVSLIIRLIYGIYCKYKFKESKFRFFWDKPLFKTLISYAGWNLWGNVASVIMGQGVNILLNIFFGPVVNAARGIAYQVKGAMGQFVGNFQIAMNPQIIKSYASGNSKYMNQLIFKGAKFSFFLLYALSFPVLIETQFILAIWLKTVPEYTIIFTQLVIITILIDCISGTLRTAAQASGRIKLYQGVVGGLLILNLPFSYIMLELGYNPEITLYIGIIISIIALICRLIILKKLIALEVTRFFIEVIMQSILVVTVSCILFFVINYFAKQTLSNGYLKIILAIIVSVSTVYFIGLDKNEKKYISLMIKEKF